MSTAIVAVDIGQGRTNDLSGWSVEWRHALDNSSAVEDVGEDPDRWLVLGPDRSGNLLEVVVLIGDDDVGLIIHAMEMRPIYRRQLER